MFGPDGAVADGSVAVRQLFITENSETLRKTRLWAWWFGREGFCGFWALYRLLTQNQEFFGRIKELSMIGLVEQTIITCCRLNFMLHPAFAFYHLQHGRTVCLSSRPFFDRVSSLLLLMSIGAGIHEPAQKVLVDFAFGAGFLHTRERPGHSKQRPGPDLFERAEVFLHCPFVYWGWPARCNGFGSGSDRKANRFKILENISGSGFGGLRGMERQMALF